LVLLANRPDSAGTQEQVDEKRSGKIGGAIQLPIRFMLKQSSR
jgi:hypothetical protein